MFFVEDRAHVRAALKDIAAGVGVADRLNVIPLPIDRNNTGCGHSRWIVHRPLSIVRRHRSRFHIKNRSGDRYADDKRVENDLYEEFVHILMIADYNDKVRGASCMKHKT